MHDGDLETERGNNEFDGPQRVNHRLTRRQHDVLVLLCRGRRNADVARELGLSERTVKGYVSQLFLIYGATNRTELVGFITGWRGDESTLAGTV